MQISALSPLVPAKAGTQRSGQLPAGFPLARERAKRGALAATAVAITAIASSPAAQAGEKLSADEIAALFPGQYEAIWKDKHEVHVEAGGNGEIRGSYGIFSGSGKWWIVGDQLCVTSHWFSRDRCSRVERQGEWFMGMHNSKGKARVRFRPL